MDPQVCQRPIQIARRAMVLIGRIGDLVRLGLNLVLQLKAITLLHGLCGEDVPPGNLLF